MPVLGTYSLTVELLDDNQVWQTIPVQSFSVNETDRDVITKFSFRTLSIYPTWDLLTLNRKVRVTEGVDGHTHITTGRILEKPKRDLTQEIQTITAKCVDDAYEATRLRFIDSWPKEGVRTWDAIVKDAWILHGPSRNNLALSFDGIDDYATIPNSSDINTGGPWANRTIELWFKANNTQDRQVLYEEGGTSRGFSIYIYNGFLYGAGWNNDLTESNWVGTFLSVPIDTNFHHVAIKLENGTDTVTADLFKLFLDGVEVASGNGAKVYAHTDGIGLGKENGTTFFEDGSSSTATFYDGVIDDVRIWNIARTQAEIQADMNKELIGNESGLVGYWKFNEGTGTIATDSTSNGNDGVINGATWTTYGVTFNGVEATNIEAERITSDLETLYDFMEKVKSRTGWTWKVVDGDLKFYDPSSVTEPVELRSDTNIRPGVQVEENMPDVANVVFIPARNRITNFEDIQNTAVGQEIYRMQYEPLNRSFESAQGTVEIDQPPEVFLWNGSQYVQQTAAEDGSTEAATADAVYNVENRWVKLQPAPVTGYTDGLKVIYTAEIPVLVRRENPDSMQVFGEIHHRIVQTPRPTRTEAEKMADQYLKNHAFPVQPMSMEIMEFHIHAGNYVHVIIPDFGIDQLMPVVTVTRDWTPQQGVTINVTLNRVPVQDDDLVIDIFNRLNKLENRETSRRERLERYWSWSDVWSWQEEVIRTMHPCPFPSNTLVPSNTLLPC